VIFSTQFAAFEASNGGGRRALVATTPLTVPRSIAADVVFVSGLTELPWKATRPVIVPADDVPFAEQSVAIVPDSIR